MAEEFGQRTSTIAALRSILGNYPYSVGLIRELLQNSDDAGALKQILVLDRRTHPKNSLYHPGLAETQGPALLAFNDAHFVNEDWISLRSAFESSKTDDSSKIGKYGVGFRSVFHITDCPQIISGKQIAIFDPLSAFIGSTGIRTELETLSSHCPNQLLPFRFFAQVISDKFDGTIIRCPLRTTSSTINSRVISPDDIAYLFRKFISEELGVTLLFLQSIQHLEIHDVSEGVSRCLATLSIDRSPSNSAIVHTFIHSMREQRTWRVMLCPFDKEEAINLLSRNSTVDPTIVLKEHKLLPSIGIAAAMDQTAQTSGRLFTYLPLPISTGFPVHIHALFALTQSRQNLRNAKEIGVVPGSTDSILIEWNRLLFENYIPLAWKRLLEITAGDPSTNNINIFNSWPPEQRSVATAGEHVYWQMLPGNVFKVVVNSNSPVWPVYRSASKQEDSVPVEYRPLDLLITAAPTVSRRVLDILTSLGLFFTCPPSYIFNMIKSSSDKIFGILTPEVAHAALSTHLDAFTDTSKDDLSILLEYLLSTDNICNVIGLPLISVSSGAIITLLGKHSNSGTYTMLTRDESAIFGSCDDNVIELGSLPYHIAQKFIKHGPEYLNVEMLSVSRIVDYLTIYPNRLNLDLSLVRSDPKAVKWLSTFWLWVNTYSKRSELFPRISNLYLLPSTKGLKKADRVMFKSRGEHPNSVNHLSKIGVPFLDPELSDQASNVLTTHGFVRLIIDAYTLLDFLSSSGDISLQELQLSHDECNTITRHMALYLPTSYSRYGPLHQAQSDQLRRLPIYPIATFSGRIEIQRGCMSDDLSYRSIGNPPFLPSVPGIGFLQMNTIATNLLYYLDPNAPISQLSDQQVLALTMEHFAEQSTHVHEAVLNYLSRNHGTTSTIILDQLREAPFVYSLDGYKRKPSHFIDPDSVLARLYIDDQSRLPRQVTLAEKNIVQALRLLARSHISMSFMRRTLTLDVVQERIDFISNDADSPNKVELAETLLELIVDAQYDLNYSRLLITPQQRWLPTNRGLRSSDECRDPNQISPSLFNHVLAELIPLKLPASLINILGWDKPLDTDILVDQLDCALDSPEHTFSDILQLVQHLSSRQDCDFERLRQITSTRKWVPTTDQQLSETQNAIFASPIADTGFHQALCVTSAMRIFLERMGCTDSPTGIAIIAKLNDLGSDDRPLDLTRVGISVNLLRCLPSDLDEELRAMILVPDEHCSLYPISSVYFNDIGEHSRLIPLEDDVIAHPFIEEPLAKKLRLGRLGLKSDLDSDFTFMNMGEKPITTVRKTLTQYTDKQFATEFFANAADAGATEFALVLDEFGLSMEEGIRVLSPTMAKFCTSPSLIVYNNSVFEDKDFIGIRQTNIGGKHNKTGTIGQFGLGALTMFHFTELAVIISNKHVLFLNPSMEHLPMSNVAAVMLSLNTVRTFYPSHLAQVDGLFGFDISSTEPYNGTIFLLPLRQTSHLEGLTNSVASSLIRNTEQIKEDILDDFCTRAPHCLLFTGISKVSATIRSQNRRGEIVQEQIWSFKADHYPTEVESETGYTIHDATITNDAGVVADWKIARTSTTNIPPHLLSALKNRHQPRLPVSAGLAAELLEDGNIPSKSSNYNFFSTLPLAISTSLPMHVMATFFLSSDRRSIRSSTDKGDPESTFNAWVLSEVIPPLYLFMLQELLLHGDNKIWWPVDSTIHKDIHSQVIIKEFYSKYLKDSPRPVFRSHYNPDSSIISSDVVLSGEEPRVVEKVLSLISSLSVARLSPGSYRLAKNEGQLSIVNPLFLREELLSDASSIVTHFTIKEVEVLIRYLLREGEEDQEGEANILGLDLLPLENGSYGTIKARQESPTYFVWWPRDPLKQHNFPPELFVHPDFNFSKNLLKLPLNITFLDPPSIERFVRDQVPASSPFAAERHQAEWIDKFWDSWKEYAILKFNHSEIMDYPLVPTVIPAHFVSLSSCKNSVSIVTPGASQQIEFIRLVLTQLGVDVVRLDDEHVQTPVSLYEILRSGEFPPFDFENVLKALTYAVGDSDITRAILDFDQEWQDAFASWARDSIQEVIASDLQVIAQRLPIWPSASNTSDTINLRPASAVFMLPAGLSLAAASQFINVPVAEYGALRLLNGPCLSEGDIQRRLDMPIDTVLSVNRLIAYKQFLEMWMPLIPSSLKSPVPVPNNNGTVMLSSHLYAREPLFEAAFGPDSGVFLHPLFEELESWLYDRGLHTEVQLDFDLFLTCVNAFESSQLGIDTDQDVARANVLFGAFGFSLPMQVLASETDRWRELEEHRFIPRRVDDRRRLPEQHSSQGFLLPMNITSLETIVSPLDLVIEEFEPIAWTQRAAFASQPDQRVLVSYRDLGRPTIREVLAHLDAIATISQHGLSASQQEIMAHDVAKTYAFLNSNSAAAADAIATLDESRSAIFLNVNDIETDDWRWDKVDDLVFETQDVDDNIRHVRKFLLPFSGLLTAAGVLPIHHPQYPSTPFDAASSGPASLHLSFENLRQKQILTDVIFIADDHVEGSEPIAHRAFLAACSEYFADAFSRDFEEARDASSEHPIRMEAHGYSTLAIETVLDYAYTRTRPEIEESSLELFLEVLKLSNMWNMLDIFEDVQREIAVKWVKPRFLAQIREAADQSNAGKLLEICTEYEERNPELIRRFNERATSG